MAQRGRKSAVSLQIVQPVGARGISRLPPPAGLTDGERALWVATVNSRPADWFGTEHVPLLVNYVRHACRADVLAAQLQTFDPKWLADEDGLRRYERISKLARDESTILNNLARAMRMTQQSLYRADKASRVVDETSRGRKPWELPPEQDDLQD